MRQYIYPTGTHSLLGASLSMTFDRNSPSPKSVPSTKQKRLMRNISQRFICIYIFYNNNRLFSPFDIIC